MNNPFALVPYISKDLFCDREKEMNLIIDYLTNGSNVTLISPRRFGKTGLIYRVFDEIKERKIDINTCYVDIYSTDSIESFIKLLAEAVVSKLEKKTAIRKFFQLIGSIRPLLSYDPITGSPEISITFDTEQEKHFTLRSIFNYLENQDKKTIVAIDEFQQIRKYEGVNMEALLRSYIQPLKNVQFLFCGSRKHLMTEMFADARSPFYESTRCIYLNKIDREEYADFIKKMFAKGKKDISDEAINYILDWTRIHTFYTQSLCNHLFIKSKKNIELTDVLASCEQILKENEDTYMQWQNLLTADQWRYLKAVAKEGSLTQPSASDFLHKYKIGAPGNSQRLLKSLIDKELILDTTDADGNRSYCVYNVFLSKWLEKK